MDLSEHGTTATVSHPALDRLAARALGRIRTGEFPAPSRAAKDRLYRRMFPDDVCEGSLSHADPQPGS